MDKKKKQTPSDAQNAERKDVEIKLDTIRVELFAALSGND